MRLGRLLVILPALALLTTPAAATEPVVAPPATAEPVVAGSLRPKPDPRPFDNVWADPSVNDVRGGRPLEAPPAPGATVTAIPATDVARLDDPVLRWLPEIMAASAATGTPRSLIAGVMRLESGGNVGEVSVASAQGLMQIMPAEMAAQGIPQSRWLDPATNIMAGATILAQRAGAGWEPAVAYYFGIGCDAYGTCTYEYATVVIGWANYYAGVLGDPIWYDVGRIPNVPSGADQTPTPTPTPQPTATESPTATAKPEQPTPTTAPEQPTPEPTTAPPSEPTAAPTEPAPEPTAAPTEPPAEPTEDGWQATD